MDIIKGSLLNYYGVLEGVIHDRQDIMWTFNRCKKRIETV